MIKAICFDLDGVFFTKKGMESFVESLVALGPAEENVRFAVFKSNEMSAFKKGEIKEQKYVEYLNLSLGLELTVEKFSELLVAGYEINEEVLSFVKQVRIGGYKTCICSNNFETRVRELSKKFDFLQYFDFTVFSYQVGILKPNKGIFEKLVNKSGVIANEIAYSDDNEEKLVGAIELGINAFLYIDFEDFKTKLTELGVNATLV